MQKAVFLRSDPLDRPDPVRSKPWKSQKIPLQARAATSKDRTRKFFAGAPCHWLFFAHQRSQLALDGYSAGLREKNAASDPANAKVARSQACPPSGFTGMELAACLGSCSPCPPFALKRRAVLTAIAPPVPAPPTRPTAVRAARSRTNSFKMLALIASIRCDREPRYPRLEMQQRHPDR